MTTYRVVSPKLLWLFDASSPEEAHFKAKQIASKQMKINKIGLRDWVEPKVFKEISRVLRGRFEVTTELYAEAASRNRSKRTRA